MTIDEYKALAKGKGSARARTKPKKEKEADSSDLSETPEQVAMSHVSVKGCQYVEYGPDYLVFRTPDNREWRLSIKAV